MSSKNIDYILRAHPEAYVGRVGMSMTSHRSGNRRDEFPCNNLLPYSGPSANQRYSPVCRTAYRPPPLIPQRPAWPTVTRLQRRFQNARTLKTSICGC